MKDPVRYTDKLQGLGVTTRNWIVYKALRLKPEPDQWRGSIVIAVLRIKKGTKVRMGIRKCRCAVAKTLRIEGHHDASKRYKVAYSTHNNSFSYKPRRLAKPTRKFSNSCYECASGIHFFRTRREAENYLF